MRITNKALAGYDFLVELTADEAFPQEIIEKGKLLLVKLCESIETEKPADLEALYVLTHAATVGFNELNVELTAAGSGIDVEARDAIGSDIAQIADAYGFGTADFSTLVAPRTW